MQLLKNALTRRDVEKSDVALKDAEIAFKKKDLTTAFNRIYNAIFYMVTAFAYKNDFSTISHSKLMEWFIKDYIEDHPTFDNELSEIYSKIFTLNQGNEDGSEFKPKITEIKELLEKAKLFTETVKKEIYPVASTTRTKGEKKNDT